MEDQNSYVPKPYSHLGLAIVTTILCCLPLGIVAILKANKVNEYYVMKQYALATQASNDAKKWALMGMLSSFIIWVIYVIFLVVTGASATALLSSLS